MKLQSLSGAWQFRQSGTQEWFPATVPGGVHTDLLALSLIPDPFVGDNEKKVQWVAESDWEYRRVFTAPANLMQKDKIWLVCDGLDTLASLTMNGHQIGRAENMFRQYRWDVKSYLAGGENELMILFDSPVQFAQKQQAIRPMAGVSQAIAGGPHLRKAPCQFGWDWGPQLPPIGIWKDIRLEGADVARLADVHLRQEHWDGSVTIVADISLQRWSDADIQLLMRVISPEGEFLEKKLALDGQDRATFRMLIPSPKLWLPNGYGDQPLYQITIEIHQADYVLDQKKYQLGLRTIELHQQPDQWGRSFQFVVNGIPVFAKGSNWIPADSFPTRITKDSLEWLIRSAAETHQNMLRVWGGGFYEEDSFYDLCDQYGILIWQDFIFSCSMYPLDDAHFLENVHQEVIENVRRLRHRASLALWCGNNEMEWGWVDWGWNDPQYEDIKLVYDRFFHKSLPAWCHAEDPDHAYWPSSPSSNTPFESPNGQLQGDAHYWDVWHGRKPFSAYRDQYPRFMSEFGFQALPPLETIRSFAEEADWNMTSYIMERHQKNDSGNSLMVGQMLDTFRLPKDFESLVYLSMVLQAEGIRYGVEHWRRHPDRVSGILYWQLNDCWPVASWSSLDYFGRWKALHYAARRFYEPLLLSIEDAPPQQAIYLTNDHLDAWEGTVRWSLETLTGEILESGQENVSIEGQEAILVRKLDFSNSISTDNIHNLTFMAELWQGGQQISRQLAACAPIKHLSLTDPGISSQMVMENSELTIELTANSLALLVEVALEGADVIFSDNYFSLPVGRNVLITCPIPEGWSLPQAQERLRLRSVYDSFSHGKAETLP